MNKQTNTYIVAYAAILVVIVAAVLAFAAIQLQPRQQKNIEIEKMGAILSSFGKGGDAASAADKNSYIEAEYKKYITNSFLVNNQGTQVEGDAFETLGNLEEVFSTPDGAYPVFVATLDDGTTGYVVPMTGKGLWGPVWGYIALKEDGNTILGASFDHKGETPGLGAEIAFSPFEDQFIGKTLFDGGQFVSINLTKGVGSSQGNPHAVDAISGGTLTSNGVKAMLKACLSCYVPFLQSLAQPAAPEATEPAADSLTTNSLSTQQ